MTKFPTDPLNLSRQSIVKRFKAGLTKVGSGCWVCVLAYKNPTGYRVLVSHIKASGRMRLSTHRLSYELFRGPIPDGMQVCHTCDNRECCNPDHLFLGTPADNARDAAMKGRTVAGSDHAHAKLTQDIADEIRRLSEVGEKQSEIARRFGITQAAVSLIVTGRTWVRHHGKVAPPAPSRMARRCKAEGCQHKARKAGMCRSHFRQSMKGPSSRGQSAPDLRVLLGEKLMAGAVEDPSGCWTGTHVRYTHDRGYGRIGVSRAGVGALRGFAHRIAFEHVNGPIPPDLVVCHACDNRRCFNPAHLYLGTQKENLRGMVERGRSRAGEKHHNARLTPQMVNEIRDLSGRMPQWKIARMYGVSQPTVSDIVTHRRWSHLRQSVRE